MTRILVADDHEVVRSGLRAILEKRPGFEAVGEASNGLEAAQAALATRPDVVILDYTMPVQNGVEATREIRARSPRTEVLIFTMHDSEAIVEDVLSAGARGYLLKANANNDRGIFGRQGTWSCLRVPWNSGCPAALLL